MREFEEAQRGEVSSDAEGWYRIITKHVPLNLSFSWPVVVFVKAVLIE